MSLLHVHCVKTELKGCGEGPATESACLVPSTQAAANICLYPLPRELMPSSLEPPHSCDAQMCKQAKHPHTLNKDTELFFKEAG